MKIETLDYLLATAQAPSISAAAEQLFLSQTTLSTAIRAVETEAGIMIFERRRNGIRVTEQGQEFLRLAGEISARYKQMMALSGDKDRQPTLRLVASPVACDCYSIAISHEFRQCSPLASLCIAEASHDRILSLVASGEYDLGIASYPINKEEEFQRQLKFTHLCCESLMLCQEYVYVGPENRFYNNSAIKISALRNEHLALSERCLTEYKGRHMDQLIPRHTVFAGIHLVRRAVEQSSMIAFYMANNDTNDWFTENSSIKKLPILCNPIPPSKYYLVYHKQETALKKKLLQCIRKVMLAEDN